MVTPYPDLRHFTVRDYGNRVGVFRILEALEDAGVTATFAVNGEIAKRYPPLIQTIRKQGHEVIAHGLSTDHIHNEGLGKEEENQLIFDTCQIFHPLDKLLVDIPDDRMELIEGNGPYKPKRGDLGQWDHRYGGDDGHDLNMIYFKSEDGKTLWLVHAYETEIEAFPRKLGWMSPARNQSSRTLELLALNDYDYCLDWEVDQVPATAKTQNGEITLIPNNYELSDFTLLHTRRQTEESWLKQIENSIELLLEEHARFGGQMLGLTLTPYVIGQPFRIWALRALLNKINSTDNVNAFTAGDIAKQFTDQNANAS